MEKAKDSRLTGRDGSVREAMGDVDVHGGFGEQEKGLALVTDLGGLSLRQDIEGGGFAAPGGGGGVLSVSSSSGGSRSGGEIRNQGFCADGFGLYASVRMWRDFGPKTLDKAMRAAWTPLGKMEMSIVEENFFLFRFEHRPDINKVLREGPWRFNDHPVAVLEAKAGIEVKREDLVMVPYWIQIYNIPLFNQTEATARYVGSLISDDVIDVDATVRRQTGVLPSFIRVKVAIDTSFRLPRGTSFGKGVNEVKMAFKYERLLSFCYLCGMVDHELADCDCPIPEGFDMNKPPYADWLRGIPPRIPVWQRQGVSGMTPGENPFMTSSQRTRRQGVLAPMLQPSLMSPRAPPSLTAPPGFHPGISEPPPRRNQRSTRQRIEDGTDAAQKKRPADDMEISQNGEDVVKDGLGHQFKA